MDAYSRALRRIGDFFDAPPDTLFEAYFESLVSTHSWSTVKVDHNGLQFFYKYALKRDWQWTDIVKPPIIKRLPDVLTLKEIERLINGVRHLRYQAFMLCCFSMGLRLGEALSLRVSSWRFTYTKQKAVKIVMPSCLKCPLSLSWCSEQ